MRFALPLAALLLTTLACAATREVGVERGAPAFQGETLDGQPLRFRPGQDGATLLAFWASWCGHCRAEAPALEALHQRGDGPRLLGVNVDREPEDGRRAAREIGITFPSLSDPELAVADLYGVTGTPTLVLVGADGRVVVQTNHFATPELQEQVGGPPPPAPPAGAGPAGAGAQLRHSGTGPTVARDAVLMATDIRIQVLTDDTERAEAAIDTALAEMARIEELMSEWRETSQVSAVNRAAGRNAVPIDRELFDLLVAARGVSELTSGKFDVTWAGAGQLWDFRADPPRLPDAVDVRSAIERVDYESLELDSEATTAFLRRPGMQLGLGGIAKGYAVDRAMGVLEAAGFENFSVNAGGDLSVRGRRGNELWWVSVRHPRDADTFTAVLPVSNASVVTSGDYERFFELDGVRYCHILDPDTGWPANGCQSVTVVATRAWWADALATGVFVLGPERGMQVLESVEGVEGMIIDAAGMTHVSSGLAPELAEGPTAGPSRS